MAACDTIVDSQKKAYILSEVYYLSGYILETGLSYAFFSHIRYTGDIYSSVHYSNKGFKTHNTNIKYQYLLNNNCVISDLVFVSSSHKTKALQKLYNEWDVKYRYEHYSNLNKNLLNTYISELARALTKIKIQYPL
jgi:hypothetical protein